MSLPILSTAKRYLKYGRSESAVRKQLVCISLFGCDNVWVHRKAAERFEAWEREVREYEASYVWIGGKKRKRCPMPFHAKRVDSFCWRKMRGSTKRSLHSFGVAVDVNPSSLDPYRCRPAVPEYVYKIAKARGLTCGHYWRRPDHPHVEWRR